MAQKLSTSHHQNRQHYSYYTSTTTQVHNAMHTQTDSYFFSLPAEIRIVIQRQYLKQTPRIRARCHLLPPTESGGTQWSRGLSVAPSLLLTCVRMYKEMRPMAFRDVTILFRALAEPQLPLRMVLPPPRQHLQNLTLIVETSHGEMMQHHDLALHLLGSPSLEEFTIKGGSGVRWLYGHESPWCFFTGLRKPLERRRGQRLIPLHQKPMCACRSGCPPSISFTFE